MKRILWPLASMLVFSSALAADWKIVTKTDDRRVTRYFKGDLVRTESSPEYATVVDYGHRRQTSWRRDIRQYSVFDWPAANSVALPQSGNVINIERDTTDTRERKQIFGRPARHLITRVTRSDAPETTIDGWYLDLPGLPKRTGGSGASFAILTSSVSVGGRPAAPRIEVKQTGPVPQGLAVWQKVTSSNGLPGASPQTLERFTEVSELTETALPDELFQPPPGYQRVARLSAALPPPPPPTWVDRLETHWRMLEDWLSTLF